MGAAWRGVYNNQNRFNVHIYANCKRVASNSRRGNMLQGCNIEIGKKNIFLTYSVTIFIPKG